MGGQRRTSILDMCSMIRAVAASHCCQLRRGGQRVRSHCHPHAALTPSGPFLLVFPRCYPHALGHRGCTRSHISTKPGHSFFPTRKVFCRRSLPVLSPWGAALCAVTCVAL